MVLLVPNLAWTQDSSAGPKAFLSDAEIRELLADRIDKQHKSVGMVVGVISPAGRRIISYGQINQGDQRPLNGDTVFEIGSITKIFTALLLADMVQQGEVSLNDPVAKYLPPDVKVPQRHGHPITLADLATHTSGLPFFPSDVPVTDLKAAIRVLATYSVPQLYQFLSTYELPREPGTRWEYSNLGFGLLGAALSRRAGKDYESLVRARITGPLGMKSTAITVSTKMKARMGVGHDSKLQPASAVNMPAFVAAGCLRSSATDLLTLLAAFMDYKDSRLAPAMAAMLKTRREGPGFPQALGWWIALSKPGDDGIIAFGGQTQGYASTIAFDPRTRVGIVVLSNGTEDDGGIGWHLLRPAFPVKSSVATTQRKTITLDPKLLDAYVGKYQPTEGGPINIERRGDALIVKFETAPQGLRLHAESEKQFFVTEADLQITFQLDSLGRPTGLTVHFGGIDYQAPRVESTTLKD